MKRSRRHIAVILNQDVEGTGFSGELVNARAGFARNFLLTGGRADIATPERQKQRSAELAKAEERRAKEVTVRQGIAEQIEAEPLELELKTGPNNRVFGAVTAADVSAALKKDRKLEVPTTQLHGLPVKQLGTTGVSVKLGLGVTASLTLNVKGVPVSEESKEK